MTTFSQLALRLVLAAAVVGLAPATRGDQRHVGAGHPYARIEDALADAQGGDEIVVHRREQNEPYRQVALAIDLPRIVIRSAEPDGPPIPLSGAGFDYSGRGAVPRAIVQFNRGADGGVLQGFELFAAHNESFNGAGVRINQANNVTIRRCVIRDNDMGIMSNGDGSLTTAVDQQIEACLIHGNGNAAHPGYNHNLYLGGTSVLVRGCEIHSSLTGHNLKSRARRTVVVGCYVHDSANREFDLVDHADETTRPGSDAVLAGNVIVKANPCEGNRTVIHFGQDGGADHVGTIFVVQNTIVTPYLSPVLHLSAPSARARWLNNIVWDGGQRQAGQVLVDAGDRPLDEGFFHGACNWLAAGYQNDRVRALALERTVFGEPGATLPFADPSRGAYALLRGDPAIVDAGDDWPEDISAAVGQPPVEYAAPQSVRPRPLDGKPDLGAYEFSDR